MELLLRLTKDDNAGEHELEAIHSVDEADEDVVDVEEDRFPSNAGESTAVGSGL